MNVTEYKKQMKTSDKINNPKVSIIIPVYNVKQYLVETLNSVINQTYNNLEIILVDDGSNDGSEIICEEYAQKDTRIKLIRRENGGLSAARNTGLDNMTGDYVAFLDSDDIFLPETIEKLVNIILNNDVNCVIFKRTLCKTLKNGETKILSDIKIPTVMPSGIYTQKEMLKAVADIKMNQFVWNKFYKREIWEDIRFPSGHNFEDLYVILRIIYNTKNTYVTNEPLILYRTRPESISHTYSIKNVTELCNAWTVFEKFIEKHTPEVFNLDQLQITKKKILIYLVLRYANALSMNFPDKTKVRNKLNEKINTLEKSVNIKNCNLRIRLIYNMIFNHPKLFSIIYPSCKSVYKSIRDNIIPLIKH